MRALLCCLWSGAIAVILYREAVTVMAPLVIVSYWQLFATVSMGCGAVCLWCLTVYRFVRLLRDRRPVGKPVLSQQQPRSKLDHLAVKP